MEGWFRCEDPHGGRIATQISRSSNAYYAPICNGVVVYPDHPITFEWSFR